MRAREKGFVVIEATTFGICTQNRKSQDCATVRQTTISFKPSTFSKVLYGPEPFISRSPVHVS